MTKNKEKEGETEDKKHWKDVDVEVMIALRGEIEPEFLKNAKKTRYVKFWRLIFPHISWLDSHLCASSVAVSLRRYS